MIEGIAQAFRLIDARNPSPELLSLRRRLLGELVGDATLMEPELSAAFEVVSHAGGAHSVISREQVLSGAQAQTGLVWVELAGLAADGELIAAHGVLRTTIDLTVTTMPLALFLHFDGGLQRSEEIFLDVAALTKETANSLPSTDELRALLQ